VAPGIVLLTPPHLGSVSVISTPSVIAGIVTVGPPHLVADSVIYVPTVVGEQFIEIPHLGSVSVIYAPSLDVLGDVIESIWGVDAMITG
jgi:hypothetical protein